MIIKKNVDLAKHSTIRIGGIAEKIYFPQNIEDIKFLLKKANQENKKFIPIGIGSNVIFKDGFHKDIFVSTHYLKGLNITEKGSYVYIEAEAGVSFKELVAIVKRLNLEGFENLSGIPASVGGAIVMNAGAFGSEIFDILEKVYWIDNDGNLRILDKKDISYSYRWTQFQNNGLVFKGIFKLKRSNKNISELIKKHLLERKKKQPLNLPTGGSTFKNTERFPAGYLLEKSGLKGFRIGDVGFSEKHANFTVNYGKGSFKDFIKLINLAKERVKERFGIDLELEMKILP
ncbi:MAG: UDP-N-acetylenolpyruvoylglucosamine reductase [Persephonella sp.]|nr:MAG: UDP-N-acetylenolpyruvoylglucosamine reductase [Persephonella sp.]